MQLVLSSFLVVYLTSAAGLDLVLAGALLSPSQLAGVAGRLGWGFVADRVPSPRLLLVGIALLMAVAAGLMSLFTTAWPVGAIAAVVILLGAMASGWNGVFLAEIIRDIRPAEVGLATSGSLMFTYLGIVLGPSLFGALASAVGFPKAYIVMGAAVLLGGILGAFRRAGPSDHARARHPIRLVDLLSPVLEAANQRSLLKVCRLETWCSLIHQLSDRRSVDRSISAQISREICNLALSADFVAGDRAPWRRNSLVRFDNVEIFCLQTRPPKPYAAGYGSSNFHTAAAGPSYRACQATSAAARRRKRRTSARKQAPSPRAP
jgi:MFS family permease